MREADSMPGLHIPNDVVALEFAYCAKIQPIQGDAAPERRGPALRQRHKRALSIVEERFIRIVTTASGPPCFDQLNFRLGWGFLSSPRVSQGACQHSGKERTA